MASFKGLRVPIRALSTIVETKLDHTHLFNPKITPPPQAWLETFVGTEKKKLGIIDLHPSIFSRFPRIDYVSEAVIWQKDYRKVSYTCLPVRNELKGDTKKPWPQKGTGRARHGGTTSNIWLHGGWAHGPRGPTTHFKAKPNHYLYNALQSMLTIKLHQGDIRIVDSLDSFQSEDSKELEEALDKRRWGPSVLIVDKVDKIPDNLKIACHPIIHINVMPTFGVNTLSLCKHETLVITLDAIKDIEAKLLFQLVRVDLINTHLNEQYRKD